MISNERLPKKVYGNLYTLTININVQANLIMILRRFNNNTKKIQ